MNMKKMIMAALLLGSVCGKASATTVGDTIVIDEVKKVRIETRDTVQRIVINGSKDDPQLHYVQRIAIPDTNAVRRSMKSVKDFNKITIKNKDGKPSKWESSLHFNIGLTSALDAPKEYDFKVWPSFEIGLSWLADWHPYGKKNVWSVGLGIDWHNLAMGDGNFLVKGENGMLEMHPYEDDQNERSTLLQMFSLQVPVMYTHYFDNRCKWGLTLGAAVNFNLNATANSSYEIGDDEVDVATKKIGQRPVTFEGIVIAHIPSFPDIYCKYSPSKVFKDGRGPKMNLLSFGLYF